MRKATPDARYRCQKRQLEVTQTPAGCRWHGRSTMPSLTCMWEPRESLSISFVFLEGRVRFMLLNLHSNNIVLKHLIYTSSLSPSLSLYVYIYTHTNVYVQVSCTYVWIYTCVYVHIYMKNINDITVIWDKRPRPKISDVGAVERRNTHSTAILIAI